MSGHGYWNATAEAPLFPKLAGDVHVDVAIVGGGLVGITAARLIKDAGLTVAVAEAWQVGRQVTGKSTAKVTSQHGLRYQKLVQSFGEERAELYAEAQQAGVALIQKLAEEYRIDADIEAMSAYVYTLDRDCVAEIEKEAEVTRRFGLPASLTRETGLPFDVLAALRFDDQAQFHPVKYVSGLAATIPGEGSHVFEMSRVVDWGPTRIVTDSGSISARHVIMASHLPLGQIGFYYGMAYPKAEPVIAGPIGRAPAGMYLNVETPKRSIRTHRHNGLIYGIAVGTSFKPGHPDQEQQHFGDLERWFIDTFDAKIEHRWVNEDYTPMDGAPFVGWSAQSGDRYLVATGFDAWGISNGTAAAKIIADLVCGRDSRWLPAFDATRIKPIAGAKEFISENLGVAAHLVTGYVASKPKSYEELGRGEAGILKIGDENVAAYRDEQGQIHALSAACTHMGCLLGWNATDRTWDCSCHGSRFDLSGDVLHGPATAPLKKVST